MMNNSSQQHGSGNRGERSPHNGRWCVVAMLSSVFMLVVYASVDPMLQSCGANKSVGDASDAVQQSLGEAMDGGIGQCELPGHSESKLMEGIPQSQCRFCGSRLRSVPTYPLACGVTCDDRMTNHADCRSLGYSGDTVRRWAGSIAGRGRVRFILQGTSRSRQGQSDTPKESILPNQFSATWKEEPSSFNHKLGSLSPVWTPGRPGALAEFLEEEGHHDRNHYRSAPGGCTGELRDLARFGLPDLAVNEGRDESFDGADETRMDRSFAPRLFQTSDVSGETKDNGGRGKGESG